MQKLMESGTVLRVAGTMSGTSLDGVDVAVIETDGVEALDFFESDYRAYERAEQDILVDALGKWDRGDCLAAERLINQAHAVALRGVERLDLVGFHGQTVAHDPKGRGTLQLGDGGWLSDALGLPVVSDFRSQDVATGGEGAPLAPFFHWACARKAGLDAPVAFLNLGGVGNLTWVDPRVSTPEDPRAMIAFDTGPANAPINDLVKARFGQAFDKDGALAATGRVEEAIVRQFLTAPYFAKSPPKSLDRNDFPDVRHLVGQLSDVDAVATLTAIAVASVKCGLRHCPVPPTALYATGGGRRNPVMMEMLRTELDCPVATVEALGLDGDMLEAQAFAYLAVRVLRGFPTSSPTTTGVRAPVSGGLVSYPRGMSNPG